MEINFLHHHLNLQNPMMTFSNDSDVTIINRMLLI